MRDVILGKAQLDVTPQQALNTMRVLELAQKSDRERRSVGWDEKIE